uniref:Uncharacterized protein n=1 Tax=Phytophthora ramorum TaxID=164328 RepID=H3GG83_PHYRM
MSVNVSLDDRSPPRATPYTKCQGRLRKRPNHELEYLRQQVVDLEEELAVLQQPVPDYLTTTGALEVCGGDTWEALAARQSSHANASLLENLKLRTMLEGQLRVARTLETAIDQHMKRQSQERRWFSGEVRRPRAASLSDELLYAVLDECMELQYAQTDSELETSGVKHVSYGHQPMLQAENGHQVRAIRDCLSHGAAGRPMARCSKLLKGDSYLHATTIDKLHLPQARDVQVKSRLVQREFLEANRTVVVWAAYVEIEGSMFVRLEEKGWVIVESYRFKRRGMALSAPGSRLKSVVRVAPVLQSSCEEEEKQHIGEMSDLIIGTYQRNFGLLYQLLAACFFVMLLSSALDQYPGDVDPQPLDYAYALRTSQQESRFDETKALVSNTELFSAPLAESLFLNQALSAEDLARMPTGYLLRFDPRNEKVVVEASAMGFPNGLTLDKDGSGLLIALMFQNKIVRFDFATRKIDDFAFLPGEPDNISIEKVGAGENETDVLMVGMVSRNDGGIFSYIKQSVKVRKLLSLLPTWMTVIFVHRLGVFASVDLETGDVRHVYEASQGQTPIISGASRFGEHIYLTSWARPSITRIPAVMVQ